jgi:hypothetical protein
VLREEGKQREREVPPEQKHQEKIRPIERGKKNREEGGLEFPKDLYIISENYRDLSVKQNFPLI